MEIDSKKIKISSMLGKRATFGAALAELAPDHDNLFVISADFTRSSGLNKFASEYTDKFLNIGIAEQDMIGVAGGMASEGYNVFATSFASFITTRCYEQVKIQCGYMRHNIKVIGLAAGVGVAQQGNTHYGLEDVSLMRAIPNITIVEPADCTEVYKVVEEACRFDGPMYIRLCGEAGDPVVFNEDYDYKLGQTSKLHDGNDVAIIASGTMVAQSLKAAEILSGKGVGAAVYNMHTIKPLDTATLDDIFKHYPLIATVEEGNVNGGMGAAVAEYKALVANAPRQILIGINDLFPHAGSYPYMLSELGLDAQHIAERIDKKFYKKGFVRIK